MMYEFEYPNKGVKQTKLLISHGDWEKWRAMPENNKREERDKAHFWEKVTKGEQWFTDKSPLFDAIPTGILECNGIYPCNAKLIS